MGRKRSSGLTTGVIGQLSFSNYDLIQLLEKQKGLVFKNNVYPHKLPIKDKPNNTIIQRDDSGSVVRIRYYDENGNAYKDIDYTDHGRPDRHKVPHTHIIEIGDEINRRKGV